MPVYTFFSSTDSSSSSIHYVWLVFFFFFFGHKLGNYIISSIASKYLKVLTMDFLWELPSFRHTRPFLLSSVQYLLTNL